MARLRKARIDKGLKIVELARLIGVAEDIVINWEKRSVKPKEKNLIIIKKSGIVCSKFP
ncbi:MAG: helix-turn-helix transcriptional regulator [Candidatus Omnitrophica bacterium]|nr:helix-turn-helix transcriptional regulator [Candidatus Omnitrophota bacterium]